MQNMKKNIYLKMIIAISIFNVGLCIPNEKRTGRIIFTNSKNLKKTNDSEELNHSTAEALSHSMGFSCITCVNQKLDFIIDINQAHYANIEKCVNIRLIDDFDQKIYDLDPLITYENKNGEISKLSLQRQDIKRYELENMLKSCLL